MINIIEGHDPGACFWFIPVHVLIKDGKVDRVEELDDEISIDEEDFEAYLYPYFKKYFDSNLDYNRLRYDNLDERYILHFEWNLEYNFYTYPMVESICLELEEQAGLLESVDSKEKQQIADFYLRFTRRIRKMMKNYPSADALSVMGP